MARLWGFVGPSLSELPGLWVAMRGSVSASPSCHWNELGVDFLARTVTGGRASTGCNSHLVFFNCSDACQFSPLKYSYKLLLVFLSVDVQWNGSHCSQSSVLIQRLPGWELPDSTFSPPTLFCNRLYCILHFVIQARRWRNKVGIPVRIRCDVRVLLREKQNPQTQF